MSKCKTCGYDAMDIIVGRDEIKELCLDQHRMLIDFRKSMDSDLPFPSADKLDELIEAFGELTTT